MSPHVKGLGHLEHGNVHKRCRLMSVIAKEYLKLYFRLLSKRQYPTQLDTSPDTIQYNTTQHVVGHIFDSSQIKSSKAFDKTTTTWQSSGIFNHVKWKNSWSKSSVWSIIQPFRIISKSKTTGLVDKAHGYSTKVDKFWYLSYLRPASMVLVFVKAP